MTTKWVVYLAFVTCFIFAKNLAMAAKPATCLRPANTLSVDLSKYSGVWYQTLLKDVPAKQVPDICIRLEFTLANSSTALVSRTSYISGQFYMDSGEYEYVSPGVFSAITNRNSLITYQKYALYLSDDAHVFKTCSYQYGYLLNEYWEVQTRKPIVKRPDLRKLLTKSKVKQGALKFIDQSKNCYTCQCKSG